MLRRELNAYNPAMLEKPFLVALNKIDQEGAMELACRFKEQYPYDPSTLFEISALEGTNVAQLKKRSGSMSKTPHKEGSLRTNPKTLIFFAVAFFGLRRHHPHREIFRF